MKTFIVHSMLRQILKDRHCPGNIGSGIADKNRLFDPPRA
jgi:hypothetical protein